VVYVDNDPIVLAHGRAMLAEDERTIVIRADIRQPAQVLSDPAVRALIDFGRPVAVIASAVLHHLLDEEDPHGAIRAVCDATPAGSCLLVSHFRTLHDPDSAALEAVMQEAFGRGRWRTSQQIRQFFGDMQLTPPGIVPCAQWQPDTDPGDLTLYQHLIVAGLGLK